MTLEDLVMMRAVHSTTVLYPSDATSAAYLTKQMAERTGIVYMRTTRGAYPVLYGPDEAFPIGGAKVVRPSPEDQVTLIGAGVTLHNCLAAADQLAGDGIRVRIVDLYSVKPIDTQTLLQAAAATGDRVVVAEDHYPAGGIGSAVLDAFNDAGHPVRLSHLAVRGPARLRDARRTHGDGRDLRRPDRPGRPRPAQRLTPSRRALAEHGLRRQACADVSTLISHSADVSGAGCSRRWSANRFTHARPDGLGHPRGHPHGAGKRPSERLAGRGGESEDSSVPGSS